MNKEEVKSMICKAIDNIPDCASIVDCYTEHPFCSSEAIIHIIVKVKNDTEESIIAFNDMAHCTFGTEMGFIS